MENVMEKRRCESEGCESLNPIFNFPGQKMGRFCANHKQDGMEDVKSKRCKTHLCNTIIGKKYQGYCLRCFLYTFPDRPVARNYKTKERNVTDFITARFPTLSWTVDKRVADGCSARRPDMMVDFGSHVLVVEVDENQHPDYSCENKRLMLLSQDINHRPLVFVRFNPDGYFNHQGTRVASCWSKDKKGLFRVSDKQKTAWALRLEALAAQITYWAENTPNKTVELVPLYYDFIQLYK
jgi:hypothetical protein